MILIENVIVNGVDYAPFLNATYDAALKALEALGFNEMVLNYGPAHIFWEDDNFETAQYCLDNFDDHKGEFSQVELEICRWSLKNVIEYAPELGENKSES